MFECLSLKKLLKTLDVTDEYEFKINSKQERKAIQHKITGLIRKHGILYTHHEYDRAIGNAIAHGSCPVKCHLYMAKGRRMLCVVRDKGEGFDYADVIRKFMSREVYFHYKGFGMRSYAANRHLSVDWKHHGKKIILYYH